MKKMLIICAMLIAHIAYSNNEQVLADLNIKINGAGKEELYFGLAEGDIVILDFKEAKGKGINSIEISEYYTNASLYADFKPVKIEGKEIEVRNTGIYKFEFKNANLAGRICAIKIRRVPGEEIPNFNTKVYWKTLYDTTYITTKEQYIAKDEYKPTVLQSTQQFWVNSGMNATFQGGNSRVGFNITLPENTVEWYYTFSASRDKETVNKTSKSFDLLGKLTYLIDQSGSLDFAVSAIGSPPGDDYCEIYLMDYQNYTTFINKSGSFNYTIEGTRENFKSGTVKVKNSCQRGTWYLGIRNPASRDGIAVAIEVVAVVHNVEYATRDKKTPIITKKKVPYLKRPE